MSDRPNIVFVMLDTVRADCLDAYGGSVRTNAIRRIASDAALYTNAISPGTYTVPSHVSLFMGQRVRSIKQLLKDPIDHCDENTDPFLSKNRYVKQGSMTLARKMSYIGYNTALFSNNPFVSQPTGLAEGFGYVQNLWFESKIERNRKSIKLALKMIQNDKVRKSLIKFASLLTMGMPRSTVDTLYYGLRSRLNRHFANEYGFYDLDKGAYRTTQAVGDYLKHINSGSNFLFINYMEAHEGYPTNLITKEYVEQDKWMLLSGIADRENIGIIKGAYDKRVAYLDTQIAKLMKMLKERGILDNAVLVFAGDHGQSFLEHNQLYHNMFPYEQLTNIPLFSARFVNGKQVKTKERVDNFVSLAALHDSILDIGYGKEEMIDGSLRRDNFVFSDHVGITEVWDTYLLSLIKKRSKYANAIFEAKRHHNTFASAVYYKNYKLLHYFNSNLKDELFDLNSDKGEEHNIIGENRPLALQMLRQAKNA
ncbi:MAG: sulfatase-like hydrolase/transferase [Candidatus Micrarchaeota archaeon]|nr:sulfatase-like hydrolase/transferase [Candidatus Micrarchaeota archaeon]MDE1848153.1 sulfatase-like hydrolase/transferase [Candidatus Micrarchaeota archaeon]MDE1864113.1 sulfatase-like hydrolase/transferase [Candidatus Micrarchaeota archaeon]